MQTEMRGREGSGQNATWEMTEEEEEEDEGV